MSERGAATWFPAWGWLAGYERLWLVPDVLAGLTTAAVVIPKAMAYATIAGLPVQAGLYTALVPVVVYALFGTSRVLSVSTTTTLGILCGSALDGSVAEAGAPERLAAAATLAMLVGAVLLLARLLRLGFVANFISDPVLIGFKAGVGLVILVDQTPKLLGIHFAKTDWLHSVVQLLRHLPETSLPTLAVGLGTLLALLLLEHFAPRFPSPLFVVAGGIAASYFLQLDAQGVSIVGPIGGGLPRPFEPQLALLGQLWAPALAIALMSFTETVAAGRAFAAEGEPRPDPDQELVATGGANLVGGVLGAMPGGGGTSQTAVNRKAGARTQLSSLASAGLALATLLFLAPVMRLLPQASLAAVVMAFSIDLISPAGFRELHAFRTQEFRWALCACAGVVLLGTLNGIVAAVVLSLLGLIRVANNPRVYVLQRKPRTDVFRPRSSEHPEDEAFPGLLILKTEGRLYFGNVQNVGDQMWPLIDQARPKVLLLDCGATPNFEYTALKLLSEAEARLGQEGTELWLAALTPEALALIQRSPLGQRLGRERMFFTVPDAVNHYLQTRGSLSEHSQQSDA